jgi:hypothetical protein
MERQGIPVRPSSRVLLLETDLDSDLASARSQIPYLREFMRLFPDVDLIAKQVHTREALVKFLDIARGDPAIKMLHLVAHGSTEDDFACLMLTGEEMVDLRDRTNLRLFRSLHTDAILLSSCRVGADAGLMRALVKVSGASAVFSYSRDVLDWQAFLIETLLYSMAFGTQPGRRPLLWREIYERLKFSIATLRIDPRAESLGEPLLSAAFGDGA